LRQKKEYWGICTKKQTSGDYHKESEKLSSTTRKRKSAEKRGKWQLKIETNINSIYPSRGQKKSVEDMWHFSVIITTA